MCHDILPDFRRDNFRHILRGQFNAGNIAVMPQPEFAYAQTVQVLLSRAILLRVSAVTGMP